MVRVRGLSACISAMDTTPAWAAMLLATAPSDDVHSWRRDPSNQFSNHGQRQPLFILVYTKQDLPWSHQQSCSWSFPTTGPTSCGSGHGDCCGSSDWADVLFHFSDGRKLAASGCPF
ncbi:hypothetical protein V8F20_002431 [Naviculisporaceae sp. PSN 640]